MLQSCDSKLVTRSLYRRVHTNVIEDMRM